MDVDIPPAQDSPKHILNVLNDDCIQSILLQMENIRDFLSAAETCIRFQENAKLTFRTHYKKIRIGKIYKYTREFERTIPICRAQSFLSIFGHFITELQFDREAAGQTLDDDVQNMIADHCGKTLKTFKLVRYSSFQSTANFNTRSPLQALEELKISNANIYNFNYYSQLRRLQVIGIHMTEFTWLIQPFPKLEMVNFSFLHQLKYNQAIRFLKLNPQLKSLTIKFCEQITAFVFENISNFIPNLENLHYSPTAHSPSEPLIHINNLRNLNSLRIYSQNKIPAERLIYLLNENNVPIEVLEINSEKHYPTAELNISELKLLKKLCLTRITDEILINLVQNLPELEEIIAVKSKQMSIDGIKRALECGKNLSILTIITKKKMTMDLDDFKTVLNLAKLGRVKVTINIQKYKFNVPSDVLDANRKWLDVKYEDISSTCFYPESTLEKYFY